MNNTKVLKDQISLFNSPKQFIGGSLALLMLYSVAAPSVAEANFWEERKKASDSANGKTSAGKDMYAMLPRNMAENALPMVNPVDALKMPSGELQGIVSAVLPDTFKLQLRQLPAWLGTLPSAYGDIQKIMLASQPEKAPLVLLIQDAHEITTAQKNISGILDHLNNGLVKERNTSLLLGVEGAAGAFKIKPYRDYTEAVKSAAMADFLLERKLINGSEFFGMTGTHDSSLWGVETPQSYRDNVQAYLDGVTHKKGNHHRPGRAGHLVEFGPGEVV